jgi:hypothetical protein
MSHNKTKSAAMLTVVAFGVASALWLGWLGAGRAGGQADEKGPAKEAAERLQPFAPTVGQPYLIYMPDGREYMGYQKLLLVQRVSSNGWVEVRTEEGQTSWLNLNHAMQLYRIEDVKKWRQMTLPGGGKR